VTVLEYLRRRDHLRFVVAAPVPRAGVAEDQRRVMAATVSSAHATEGAAKEAIRWEREQFRRQTHDWHKDVALLVVDLEALTGDTGGDQGRESPGGDSA
jgi:hypothetical protein